MNNFERPDYDTEKFGRMFAERFFMDSEFCEGDYIILENVCAAYIQSGRKETVEESECFELVIIRGIRVLAAVSVAELPPPQSYGKPFLYKYRRRERFNRLVRAKFEGMGFTEIDKKSCGRNEKKADFCPEEMLFYDEKPVKEELCRIRAEDYEQVRSVVLENLRKEKPPEYLISFRHPQQGILYDEKARRRLMREGLIRRENSSNNRIPLTAYGRSLGLVSAYRGGKNGAERVVMAVDNGMQDFEKIKRWELGIQSREEEIEIFGWRDRLHR